MRPVSGFDRPVLQWGFLALSVMLMALAAGEAIALRRTRARNELLHASELNARLDRQQLELTLKREQSAREALARELSRRGAEPAPSGPPTLTLTPLGARGSRPPEPTVDRPPTDEVLQLRLQLPRAPDPKFTAYGVAVRKWSTGETIWTRSGLRPQSIDGRHYISGYVTGDVFTPAAYEIVLTATTADGQSSEVAAYEVGVRATPR